MVQIIISWSDLEPEVYRRQYGGSANAGFTMLARLFKPYLLLPLLGSAGFRIFRKTVLLYFILINSKMDRILFLFSSMEYYFLSKIVS